MIILLSVPADEVRGGVVAVSVAGMVVLVDPDFSETFSSESELSIIVDKVDFVGDTIVLLEDDGAEVVDIDIDEDEDAVRVGGILLLLLFILLAEAKENEKGSHPDGKGVYLFGLYKGVGRGEEVCPRFN